MTGLLTLMQQGGLIMWLLFIVALLQIYLFLQRWLTWPSLNWLPTASSPRPQLQRRTEHLLALNQLEKGLPLLKALVVITPLLGLTGTVTGMMLVFDGLSLGGAADPRRLSSGIARAILPTFASMAVVLLGMFFLSFWQRRARKTLQGH